MDFIWGRKHGGSSPRDSLREPAPSDKKPKPEPGLGQIFSCCGFFDGIENSGYKKVGEAS
jgi:hypothetical protein